MKRDETQNDRELFLDTTYIMPFFQIPIAVKGFKLSGFKEFIKKLSRVHVAELSIYEAKAKLLRLSKIRHGYEEALQAFGPNLNVLREDEKFVFHEYTSKDDEYLNQLLAVGKGLDAFDLLILCQAFAVGELLTEDEALLRLGDSESFDKSALSKSIRIRRWKEIDDKKSDAIHLS